MIKDDSHYLDADIPENLFLHNQRTSLSDTHLDQFERTYRNFGIPYRYRWDLCPVAEACKGVEQLEVPSEPYIFIHDDPARGFVIDRARLPEMPVYRTDSVRNESILSFKNVIENAAEVHVWDSSFFHLTEALNPKGKLYYHRYVSTYHKRYGDYKTIHKWTILT